MLLKGRSYAMADRFLRAGNQRPWRSTTIRGNIAINATMLHLSSNELHGDNIITEYPWYALRVKSRFDFVTSAALQQKGFEQYLPTLRCRRRWRDRIKDVDLPLFPGYVFSRFERSHRLQVLNTPGVVYIVGIGNYAQPIDEGEIAAIRLTCRSGLPVTSCGYLNRGERVLLERGPLAGLEGIVTASKGQYRIVLSLSLLQRSISVEVEREWIRPVVEKAQSCGRLAVLKRCGEPEHV